MDEKTKLYVFSKKEVALIFLFMIVTAATSFVVGVKMGKSFSYAEAGLEEKDRQMVDILSGQEEMVNEVVDKQHQETKEKENVSIKDLNQRLEEKLIDELSGKSKKISAEQMQKVLEKKNSKLKNSNSRPIESISDEEVTATKTKTVVVPPVMEMAAEKSPLKAQQVKDNYRGKYTIQLGSHRTLREAEEFAEGFKVRGYNPIINEVELPNKGIWFQVSLGAFDKVADARDYIKKEYSLFQGQDFYIKRFD